MCDYCSWIEKIVRPPTPESLPITICTNVIKDGRVSNVRQAEAFSPMVLVHGSGNSASREENDEFIAKLEEAAIEGYRALVKNSEAVDGVEQAIRQLESQDTTYNLNHGMKNFTRDAIIMDSDSKVGSVGGVINVNNPITLARRVLRDTDNVLVVGNGVQNLATEPDELFQINEEKNIQADSSTTEVTEENEHKGHKVWGALARDREGRLACGISTLAVGTDEIAMSIVTATGTVPGCGVFAEPEFCCSVSGVDSAIYLNAPARKIIERLRQKRETEGTDLTKSSMEKILEEELKRLVESGGESSMNVAVLGTNDEPCLAFKTTHFPWACCNAGVVTSGCSKGEVLTKNLKNLDMPLNCRCN